MGNQDLNVLCYGAPCLDDIVDVLLGNYMVNTQGSHIDQSKYKVHAKYIVG